MRSEMEVAAEVYDDLRRAPSELELRLALSVQLAKLERRVAQLESQVSVLALVQGIDCSLSNT